MNCILFKTTTFCVATIAVLAVAVATADADLLYGVTQTTFASGGTPVDLTLSIDTVTEKVNFEFTGRSDGWFAVGFGGSTMANTYGIIAMQDGSVEERRLSYSGGTVLNPELTVLSNTVSGNLRTLVVERDLLISDTDYYDFPTTESTIALISASAAGGFGYHGADNRSSGSISVAAVPEPGTLAMFGLASLSFLRLRRRRF